MKKILLSILASAVFTCGSAQKTTNLDIDARKACKEVLDIRQTDLDLKQRLNIKDKYIKQLADSIERAFVYADNDSSFGKLLDFIFYSIFGGALASSDLKGLVHLSPDKAPRINEIAQELATKFDMPQPPIFLALKKDLFNAMATSFSVNKSMVIVGQDLLEKIDDNELRSVLAHEFSHIYRGHQTKILLAALTMFVGSYFIIKQIQGALGVEKRIDEEIIKPGFISKRNLDILLVTVSIIFIYLNNEIMLMFSRHCEKEADNDALRVTSDPDSFISCEETFKAEFLQKIDQTKEYQSLLHTRLALLSEKSPWIAKFYKWHLDSYVVDTINMYKNAISSENGTHPSVESRIKVAQEMQKEAATKTSEYSSND